MIRTIENRCSVVIINPLQGTEEKDILVGTGGLTIVDGRGGNDILVSKNGAICYGRDGDDILISAGGGTNLIGGLGSDKQHSGTEGDIFWYNSAAETVGDEIYGFQSGKDKVKLEFVGCPDGFTLSDVQRDGNNILWVETEEQGVRLKGYTEFQPGTAPQIDILFKGLTELKASDIDGVRAEIRGRKLYIMYGDTDLRDYSPGSVQYTIGGDRPDTVVGDDQVNLIAGEGGDDTITGSLGGDRLVGGPGWDSFVYRSVRSDGR